MGKLFINITNNSTNIFTCLTCRLKLNYGQLHADLLFSGLITRLCNPLQTSVRTLANEAPIEQPSNEFDKRLLDYLVCPLSKTPLRFGNTRVASQIVLLYIMYVGNRNMYIAISDPFF